MPTMMLSRLRDCVDQTRQDPNLKVVHQRHRHEWPELWAALDELFQLDDAAPSKSPGRYNFRGVFIRHEFPGSSTSPASTNGTHS